MKKWKVQCNNMIIDTCCCWLLFDEVEVVVYNVEYFFVTFRQDIVNQLIGTNNDMVT